MATFKIGQRVRIANPRWSVETKGMEAVILAGPFAHLSPAGLRADVYRIDIIGFRSGDWHALADELAPLTDPGCESFLQAMRDYAEKHKANAFGELLLMEVRGGVA